MGVDRVGAVGILVGVEVFGAAVADGQAAAVDHHRRVIVSRHRLAVQVQRDPRILGNKDGFMDVAQQGDGGACLRCVHRPLQARVGGVADLCHRRGHGRGRDRGVLRGLRKNGGGHQGCTQRQRADHAHQLTDSRFHSYSSSTNIHISSLLSGGWICHVFAKESHFL